ncbi:MAG: tRNA (adenosine(37)-N6)-dimethylallyltransferase MiaA [Balneolaceae bacterium]
MILGPTASGKSEIGVAVAERIGGEILSVDSRQCFRGVPIGTAQPTDDQLRRIRHHNVACLDPKQKESVSAFNKRRESVEQELTQRNTPLLYVGGSTLHLQSILQPLDPLPPANPANIADLEARMDQEGVESLYNELRTIDPKTASKMDGHNRHRILRALDVWMQTGRTLHSFHRFDRRTIQPPEDLVVVGLHWDRAQLYRRIEERVDRMLEEGLIDETRSLMNSDIPTEAQIMTSVGYREIQQYLEGAWSLEEATTAIKTASRRYAKRQLTWFRPWSFIHWMDAASYTPDQLAGKVLTLHSSRRSGSS